MSILIILSLLLTGGTVNRPVEDDLYTSVVLAVSGAIEGPDATLIFEPYKSGTFIGAVGPDDECSTGVWYDRKSRTVTPLEVTCP